MSDLAQELARHYYPGLGFGAWGIVFFSGLNTVVPEGNGPYFNVVSSGGRAGEVIQNSAILARENPSAQVTMTLRLTTEVAYDAAMTLLHNVFLASTKYNITINSAFYEELVAMQSPFDFPPDGKSRMRKVFNVRAKKAP